MKTGPQPARNGSRALSVAGAQRLAGSAFRRRGARFSGCVEGSTEPLGAQMKQQQEPQDRGVPVRATALIAGLPPASVAVLARNDALDENVVDARALPRPNTETPRLRA